MLKFTLKMSECNVYCTCSAHLTYEWRLCPGTLLSIEWPHYTASYISTYTPLFKQLA